MFEADYTHLRIGFGPIKPIKIPIWRYRWSYLWPRTSNLTKSIQWLLTKIDLINSVIAHVNDYFNPIYYSQLHNLFHWKGNSGIFILLLWQPRALKYWVSALLALIKTVFCIFFMGRMIWNRISSHFVGNCNLMINIFLLGYK